MHLQELKFKDTADFCDFADRQAELDGTIVTPVSVLPLYDGSLHIFFTSKKRQKRKPRRQRQVIPSGMSTMTFTSAGHTRGMNTTCNMP